MRNHDVVLLTGLPRSGTTLMCHLLNKLPNAVALAEPMDIGKFRGLSDRAVIRRIERFANAQRKQILRKGVAASKSAGVEVPSNFLVDQGEGGARKAILDGKTITVTNLTTLDFSLYIKHPNFFSAGLPFLSQAFECYASVRNPLSVLLSWQDCPFSISQGRAPAAEQVSTDLRAQLNAERDVLTRQLIILDFLYQRYHRFLPGRVVRYEDVINSGGRALVLINDKAEQLNEALVSRNSRLIRSDPNAKIVAGRLLESENACWNFYSRGAVQRLLG